MNEYADNRGAVARIAVLIYAVTGYLAFLAVFVTFILWSVGAVLPHSLDQASLLFNTDSTFLAVAVNLGLIALFGLQHSVMARDGFKRRLKRLLPPAAERATFIWASNLMLLLLMAAWQPLPATLWQAEGTARGVLLGINAAGWLFLIASTYMVDNAEFIGLRQAWDYLRRKTTEAPAFVTHFAYRFVRHPMMTGMLVGLWVVPTMSWGHLLLSGGLTVYILVGTRFEEKSLEDNFGEDYRRYQEQVPMMIPRPGASVAKTVKTDLG